MAEFTQKNWLNTGDEGANANNSVLNKENMNDLEKRIANFDTGITQFINTKISEVNTNINKNINSTIFLNQFITDVSGNNPNVIDVSSKVSGNNSFLIFLYGAHSTLNSNHYTLKTYILRITSSAYNLKEISSYQTGNIDLNCTYDLSQNKITVTNSGSYGAHCSLAII